MNNLKPPEALIFDNNVSEHYKKFMQTFDIYLRANDLIKASDERKIAILLNVAGDEAVEVFNTFIFEGTEGKQYSKVIEKFQEYCQPRSTETYERFKFFSRSQADGEEFDNFVKGLKTLAKNCNFGEQESSLIRDRIILGIQDTQLQERLLRINNLDLMETIKSCRAAEATRQQIRGLREKEVSHINKGAVKKTYSEGTNVYDCLKCGHRHSRGNCLAFGRKCMACGGLNHFQVGCKVYKSKNVNKNHKKNDHKGEASSSSRYRKHNKVNELGTGESNDDDDLFIDNLTVGNVNVNQSGKCWQIDLNFGNHKIRLKMDTGAECNVLPLKWVSILGKTGELKETNETLKGYGNNKINVMGYINLQTVFKEKPFVIKFYVVEVESIPILGLNACIKLGLITKNVFNVNTNGKNEFVKANHKVFSGVGKLPVEYEIKLKNNYEAFVSSCRRVPEKIKSKLKDTLNNLESKEIITKVDGPSEWVNNIVIVEKSNGSLRVCLDPSKLNKYICPEQYPIPTVEDIGIKLKDKKLFSVLDMKDGFYQLPLTSNSTDLCTFITPYGKYKFLRLPFGVCTAPEAFQRYNEKIFGDLKIGIYIDDLIIAGKDEKEHDLLMNKVVERATKFNIKFNSDKLQYKVGSVKYLGQIFDSEGMRPDSNYLEAIVGLDNPTNKKELLRVLGMLTYLIKYIPVLAEMTAPLRSLIKNDTEFIWTTEHTNSFNKIKEIIVNIPTLKIFDHNVQTIIQTDASQNGIGGCLMQQGRPIFFCSRSLTEHEKNWAIIEKEYLAIVFCLTKFHQFVYGKLVIINTDHKPLLGIQRKDINKISLRLQRLRLKALKYNFSVEYVPGRLMYIADLLSRSFIKKLVSPEANETDIIHTLEIEYPIANSRLIEIGKETGNDENLKLVKEFCESGWPQNINNLNSEVKKFYKIKDSLFMRDNIIYNNDKIIIPKVLQNNMLNQLHKAHFGIEKTKNRARKIFYWVGMSRDIEDFIKKCRVCEKYGRSNVKEPLMPHLAATLPFEKIGSDILEFKNKNYLVVIDYYSRWIELKMLRSKTIDEVIQILKEIFACHGKPKVFISDNNPYNSHKFKIFAQQNNIELVFSSPRYPKSNGMAEKAVGICKSLLRKSYETGQDIWDCLLEYRVTPLCGLQVSPSELIFSRLLNTNLPISDNNLKPKVVNIQNKIELKQNKYKYYYDRSAKAKNPFEKGDNIVMQKDMQWIPAKIVNPCVEPRSYIVQDNTGSIVRRNSSALRTSKNEMEMLENKDLDIKDNIINDRVRVNSCDSATESEKVVDSENVFQSEATTRSGRIVTRPSRFKDFVTV